VQNSLVVKGVGVGVGGHEIVKVDTPEMMVYPADVSASES
jgi:hypothetical protein